MKLTRKIIIEEIIKIMSEWTNIRGFKYLKSLELFVQKGIESDKKIYLDLITWNAGKSWNLSFQLHVRFHQIEDILNKYRDYVSEKRAKETSTFAMHIGNLCRADPFQISSIADITSYKHKIEEDLDKFAMPYLNKYSSIYSVKTAFESSDRNHWPIQDTLVKCEVLLCICLIQNEEEEFCSLAEEFENLIKEYRDGFFISSFHEMVLGMKKDYLNLS